MGEADSVQASTAAVEPDTQPGASQDGSSNVHSSSATATEADILLRPNIRDLLTLVGACLQSVLLDPAVMGGAHQPAAWMPDKASLLASVAQCESRVRGSIDNALSPGLLQQDML
jgi:hypothetical protein